MFGFGKMKKELYAEKIYDVLEQIATELKKFNEQKEQELKYRETLEHHLDVVIKRAMDMWGLDYAELTNGLYPKANQIGRRPIMPTDYHTRKSWLFSIDEVTGQLLNIGNLDDNIFHVITGVAIRKEDRNLIKAVGLVPNGTQLPMWPVTAKWKVNDGFLIYEPEIPMVLSPTANLEVRLDLDQENDKKEFWLEILGTAIGKRPVIIMSSKERMEKLGEIKARKELKKKVVGDVMEAPVET